MLTPQPKAACEFFGKLLGWTYVEMPGMGYTVLVGGRNIGGLFDLHGPNTPPGTPAYIGVMVKVENADALCQKIAAFGGKARPAFDIMDHGRLSVCFDPNGGEFDAWEPQKMHGTDVDSTLHGAPCWFQTLTSDVELAAKFYCDVFGWTAEVKAMPMRGVNYTSFKLNGEPVAGMLPILPQMGEVKPHWATYFTVSDVTACARDAVQLGAKLCVRVHDIPDVGSICGITSPQGVTFYVFKPVR